MTYRSPAHHALSVHVSSLNTALEYVELACTLREMKYREDVTIEAPPPPSAALYVSGGARPSVLSIKLTQSLKSDILEFAAERCEEIARKLLDAEPPRIDVKAACKV